MRTMRVRRYDPQFRNFGSPGWSPLCEGCLYRRKPPCGIIACCAGNHQPKAFDLDIKTMQWLDEFDVVCLHWSAPEEPAHITHDNNVPTEWKL
jgi:hypothetical protein